MKITANDSWSCLGYLNKLVEKYNNTYHHSIGKKPTAADNSVLAEEIEWNPKAPPKFRVGESVKITKQKSTFSKGYTKNWSKISL